MAVLNEPSPEELFDMFVEQHPNMVKRVVNWYKTDDYEIRLDLVEGNYVYFDYIYNGLRRPFKVNGKSYEEAWRKMFAFKLERRMFIMGYTQYQLAEKSGLSYVTISKYLNGRANPSGSTLAKLAKVLECTLDAFDEDLVEY